MKELLRTPIAGLQYYDYQLVAGLKAGRKVKLIHEPSNAVDTNAIRCEIDGVKIGYIPRDKTYLLHAMHDKGIKLFATVCGYHKNNPTWSMLHIKVEFRERKFVKKETEL